MRTNPSDLSAIAQRLSAGDVDAFDALFVAVEGELRRYVYSYVRSWEIAEEIVQDAFLQLWDHRAALDLRAPTRLLYTTARRRALDHLKRERVRSRALRRYEPEVAANPGHDPDVVDAAVAFALQSLTPRQREVVQLRWQAGLSYDEIGRHLNISPGTVATHLKQAVAQIRAIVLKQLS